MTDTGSAAARRGAAAAVLGQRELNRAVLHRQLLLRRHELAVVPAVERLFGLNAQDANLPYLALWSRLDPFAVADLTAAVEDGRLVRSTMIRATQHLTTAADFELIRPAVAALLLRVQRNAFGSRTDDVDLAELVAEARELLADGSTLTRPELGRRLAATRQGADPNALGWTVQYLEPVVHPAPSGTWNVRGATPFRLASDRARRERSREDVQEMVRRYLAAFGPASTSDIRAWSGVTGLREIVDSLRGELCTFADENGRELLDLPDAPRPPADTPAPVRLLPEFDAPLLAYADRSRMMTDEVRRQVIDTATVLVDGTVAATWTIATEGDTATLVVRPLRRLSVADRDAVEAEATALVRFFAANTERLDPAGARVSFARLQGLA